MRHSVNPWYFSVDSWFEGQSPKFDQYAWFLKQPGQAEPNKNSKASQNSSLTRGDIHMYIVKARSDAFYNPATGTLMLLQISVYVLVRF